MSSDIKNKVIVLIGSEGLLGKGLNSYLTSLGACVVSADKSLKDVVQEEVDTLRTQVDITNVASIEKLIKITEEKFERIDCLINTSYPRSNKNLVSLEDVTYEDFCENLNLHLGGYFLATKTFASFFALQGHGNVINFASIYGVIHPRFEIYNDTSISMPIHYAAIKSALIHLTGYYAKYYKGKNIRFNTISPGGIANDHEANFSNQYKEYTLNKGLLDSEDILGSVEYLVSDKSKFVNGQNIVIDDGFTL
tara:strand:+ start:389 stop:1141 length:753 start_codon:yes stop_codon:yes gene_type:complete